MLQFLLAEVDSLMPSMGKSDHFLSEFLNMLMVLGLLVGLLILSVWFMKRFFKSRWHKSNQNSPLKILERRSLNPKANLYLIEIYNKTLVIAESPHGINLITEFPLQVTQSEKESSSELPPMAPLKPKKFSLNELIDKVSQVTKDK